MISIHEKSAALIAGATTTLGLDFLHILDRVIVGSLVGVIVFCFTKIISFFVNLIRIKIKKE